MSIWIPALATGFAAAAVDTMIMKEDLKKVFTKDRILGIIVIAGVAALVFGAAGTLGVKQVSVPQSVQSYNSCPGCSGLVQVD